MHMINSAIATGIFFKLSENTRVLLCMSPNYIAGKMMLVRALTLGWHIDVVAPTSNPLENIEKEYDFSAMVPLQLYSSLNEIYKIKKLIVGGGVVSKELLNEIQHIKTEVFATYGMTETSTHIAVKKLNNLSFDSESNTKIPSQVENDIRLRKATLVSASHYKTLRNIKISTDKRGCLIISAPKVSNAQIITNDLVELVSETSFNWLGRFDSIINSGGIKLIPEQLEEKLSAIIEEPFFIAGLPDAVLGEKLVLVVENLLTERNRSALISTSLNPRNNEFFQKIKELKTLSKYEIPKEIYFVDYFVRTPTGKINRRETLKLLENS
jgi:O-succinylbenzoic acid--CoA ligase